MDAHVHHRMMSRWQWMLMPCLLLATPFLHAAERQPLGRGLHEIPDSELGLMRGRYTVGDNKVMWFGVSMITTWQTQTGQTVQGSLKIGMDFSKGAPTISFTPNVIMGSASSDAEASPGSRSIDSAGLNNASGLVQSVQVAGDGNRASNVTSLVIREGSAPTLADATSSGTAQATQGAASANAHMDASGARLVVGVAGQGVAEQWVKAGAVGQSIRITGDGQQVGNRLQLELVKQALPTNALVMTSVAKAIALNQGIGQRP